MRVVVLALLLTSLLSAIAVPSGATLPACTNAATATVQDTYHVQGIGIRAKVWEESNGLGGLQTADCTHGGRTHKADTFVRQLVPHDLGFGGPCVFLPVVAQCI